MAATKAAKKTSAKKTTAKKAAPKGPSDVDLVKESAANPAASRAGERIPLFAAELEGVSFVLIDGARAEVEIDKQTFDQSQLHTLRKLVDQAIGGTY